MYYYEVFPVSKYEMHFVSSLKAIIDLYNIHQESGWNCTVQTLVDGLGVGCELINHTPEKKTDVILHLDFCNPESNCHFTANDMLLMRLQHEYFASKNIVTASLNLMECVYKSPEELMLLWSSYLTILLNPEEAMVIMTNVDIAEIICSFLQYNILNYESTEAY